MGINKVYHQLFPRWEFVHGILNHVAQCQNIIIGSDTEEKLITKVWFTETALDKRRIT